MATIRDLPPRSFERWTFWATIRQPKERRARNRRPLRAAEALQRHSKLDAVKNKTGFDVVWWKSSSIVLGSRGVVEVREPDNNYKWTDGWYGPNLYSEKQDCIISEVGAIE